MSLKVIDGNLIDLAEAGMFDVIVHGCNCLVIMGAGIAKEIANRYPQAYEADKKTKSGDASKLGKYTYAIAENKLGEEFVIVNAYTQYNIGGGEDVFDYEAFDRFLNLFREDFRGLKMGFPLIGCGLAGGDETRIVSMIKTALINEDVTIVRFVNKRRVI